MAGTVIIQRTIPHYRIPLFRALNERFGIKVVTAADPPQGTGLKLVSEELADIVVPSPFRFPQPAVAERARYPIHWIVEHLAPDTVVSEFGLRQSSAWGLPIARHRGRFRRLIFWTHGWMMERGFRKPTDLASQYARLPPFAAADVLATYSEEGAHWLRRVLPWKPVVALGNPLDHRVVRAAAAEAAPIRHGEPQFLSIGRLKADKGFDLVLDAFRRVRAVLPDAALTIIGDGPERTALEALAGADLGGSVRFCGALYDERDLAPHFLGADLYLLGGAAGLSVNHALAYGLPVAAFPRTPAGPFHHPEIEYVVHDQTGLLVDRYDTAAMADAVIAAFRNSRLGAIRAKMATAPQGPTIESFVANFGRVLEAADR